ncbi:MAG: zinc ribbon domain-containing protein [Clostridiales bacterium]|nr:zinc ribbon domain-containing protein [Clostridiales bacterium]
MFCTKCGTQLTDDSRFCYKCGAPMNHDEEPKDTVWQGELDNAVAEKPEPEQPATQPVAQPATAQPQQQKALSSAADDGIISILGFVFAFSAPLIGLVLSLIGYRKPKYRNLAIAGITVGTILLVGLLVIVAIGFKNMSDSSIPLFILIATLL